MVYGCKVQSMSKIKSENSKLNNLFSNLNSIFHLQELSTQTISTVCYCTSLKKISTDFWQENILHLSFGKKWRLWKIIRESDTVLGSMKHLLQFK